jgi:hypothetical protein
MMKFVLKLLPLFCVAIAGVGLGAGVMAASHDETLFLFESRKVTINVPEGFSYVVTKDEVGIHHVKLADPKKHVSLDIVFLPDREDQFRQVRARREMLNEQFGDYVNTSSEKGIQFEELEPRAGAGTYCVFTDAKLVGKTDLPAGEYLHLTAGLKTWPGVLAIFRLFSNDTTSAEYQAAMKMLRESVQEKPVPLK